MNKNILALLAAALLGLFFLLRGIWVGMDGVVGSAMLNRRDWILVGLFLLTGVRLLFFVFRRCVGPKRYEKAKF